MSRLQRPVSGLALALAILATGFGLILATSEPAWTDDRDLLRFQGSQPYLFLILDTSASMNQKFGVRNDEPTVGFGDDPDSRIYTAKEALFNVFKDVNDVNFGFASFNLDRLRVPAIHWLYYLDTPPPAGWPLPWPQADPDGLTQLVDSIDQDTDGDGVSDSGDGIPDAWVNDVEGSALVFGEAFVTGSGAPIPGGTCDVPIDLNNAVGLRRADAFAKLGTDGSSTTTMYLRSGGTTYQLLLSRVGLGAPGDPFLTVDFRLSRVERCTPSVKADLLTEPDLLLRLDQKLNDIVMVDGPALVGGDPVPGLWPWTDAVDNTSCGSGRPFTGNGWEGNYDSGVVTGDPAFDSLVTNVDRFCVDSSTCQNLRFETQAPVSTFGRALDRGDLLPFDWLTDNKVAMLQRLAPNWPSGPPDFGVASHLQPGTGSLSEYYVPRLAGRKPLIASGRASPLGKSILDFRCWYAGRGSNKCRDAAFFDAGWSQTACTYDPDYGCRKPYQIIVTDGGDNCPGENPSADVASLNAQNGVKTWVLNLGDPQNCQTGLLGSIVRPGNGECITPTTKDELRRTIENILGEIREEARAFASAAVPSVQASADQAIYVSNFIPLNAKPVWDGHLNAFLKPIPVDDDGRPDTSDPNFLWDAGHVLKTFQYDATDFLDDNDAGRRRVFYSQSSDSGAWSAGRRLLDPTDPSMDDSIRYDLWRGFGFIGPEVADGSLLPAQETTHETGTNTVIAKTLTLKSAVLATTGETIEYLLGDLFHSSPVVVGTPNNAAYFAANVGSQQDRPCNVTDTGANDNRGYQCFLLRHRFRRKALVAGSNDGMVHAFNAGLYDDASGVEKYDNGTGHELWAYVPRAVMPTLTELAVSSTHKYTVDGSPAIADVFIDPVHPGTPDPDDRLWRTALVMGLREGGPGYFALDITQPDEVEETAPDVFVPRATAGGADDAIPGCVQGGADCGPLPYPAALWEFFDSTADSHLTGLAPAVPVLMDEDRNGQPDLADTWSTANMGRVLLCKDGAADCSGADLDQIEDRYVAIFGGGLDPENKTAAEPAGGNWIYMVDIETGKVIYKREVLGSVPSEVAAVDTSQNGYLDRIYFGTTAGRLYRIDLGRDSSGNVPQLEPMSVQDLGGVTREALRIPLQDSSNKDLWRPRIIFDANFDDTQPIAGEPRAIYHRPSVLFATKLGLYGLAFGTGDREDLWSATQQEGRLYLFIDDTDNLPVGDLPLIEGNFQRIVVNAGPQSDDLLLTRTQGHKGWYLVLDPNEKVITDTFSLSGVTFFSSFQPEVALTDDNGNPIQGGGTCGDKKFEQNTDNLCSKVGSSRLFVVNTTNANPFLPDLAGGGSTRHWTISSFVTNPYTERSANKNFQQDSGGDGSGSGAGSTDDLTDHDRQVMETLKGLFPKNCRFANYGIDIKTITAETAIQRIARVPVCIGEKNWKDF